MKDFSDVMPAVRQRASRNWIPACAGMTTFFFILSVLFSAGIPRVWAWGDHPHPVRFDQTVGGWRLVVDEKPYFIKGVGCNTDRGRHGEDYLRMARDMGANTVRTWGMVPRSFLDRAQSYGLKVDVGIWLEPVRNWTKESYTDEDYCRSVRARILAYVHNVKNHPAVLFWNAGNEVFTYTESENERQAFGEFYRELLREIHQEDPDHPVVYASSRTTDLPYLKAYAPTLDAVGFNGCGQVSVCVDWLAENHYDKPAFLSEYGPSGPWERPHDENDQPWDVLDHIKASDYVSSWRQVEAMPKRCVGGFAFVLGEQRNQDSLTWFNINLGSLKREAYWQLRRLYTGQAPEHPAPRIHQFKATPATGLRPGDWITVTTDAVSPEGASLHYSYFIAGIFSDPLVVDPPVYYHTAVHVVSPGAARVRAPRKPGTYRLYVIVANGHDNAAVADRSIQVVRR